MLGQHPKLALEIGILKRPLQASERALHDLREHRTGPHEYVDTSGLDAIGAVPGDLYPRIDDAHGGITHAVVVEFREVRHDHA